MNTPASILTRLTDIVFPRACCGCGNLGTFLCARCLEQAPRAEPLHSQSNSFITAIFDYRHPAMRRVIWRFKYKNARSIAALFGGALYDEIINELGNDLRVNLNEKFLLVPIPLHAKRLRERGYNQSELLAKEIAKHDADKIFEIELKALTRTHATKAQAKSEKRATRFENLRGAFLANPGLVRGKHIILIDDVTTTGATLSEARKALLKAGAKTVRAYTVAH